MPILGYFLNAVSIILDMGLNIFLWLIIIRAILSWVSHDPYNPVIRMIHDITEPVLRLVRLRIPGIQGLDISPMIVIFGIIFLQAFVVNYLKHIAMTLM